MSYKIGVIGCGNVGAAYVHSLICQPMNINEIVLIDKNKEKAEGMAMDMCHSLAFSRSYVNKIYIGEYSNIKDADILCITAGMLQDGKKRSRLEDLEGANIIIDNIMDSVMESGFSGIILVASNPLDVITQKIADRYNKQYSKVIGSGTLLETARLRYDVANKLGFPVKSISGYVYGEHGASQVPLWSTVKVNNTYKITDYLTEKEMTEIAENVKTYGSIVSIKQGYTCYGVAECLSKLTRIIANNEEEEVVCSTYDKNKGIYLGNLSRVNKDGVVGNCLLKLSKDDQELYDLSANVIKEAYDCINK